MLRITKGLKPFIEEGISIYTDAKGNKYVRVKEDDEDFCIAAHDYTKGDHKWFTWDKAMEMLKDKGLTTFTAKQAELYEAHYSEINDKFKEIEGEELKAELYWTITEADTEHACCYWGEGGDYYSDNKHEIHHRIRPIINL